MENPKMNLQIVSSELTMTSREIAELLECRHDSVKRTIERLVDAGIIQLPPMVDVKNDKNQTVSEYVIGKRDTYVIVAQLSPEFTARLVDRWQELEAAQAPRQLTASEMFLQNAQILVDLERKQNEQAQQLLKIQSEVKQVAATQLLTSRPQNAESITHLRPRAAKQFGLPERIVEYIIRQTPYAPKPAGMVRNDNEKADGATYAVYWVKDINDVMKRFVKECTKVSAAYATHPLIEGKFKFSGDAK